MKLTRLKNSKGTVNTKDKTEHLWNRASNLSGLYKNFFLIWKSFLLIICFMRIALTHHSSILLNTFFQPKIHKWTSNICESIKAIWKLSYLMIRLVMSKGVRLSLTLQNLYCFYLLHSSLTISSQLISSSCSSFMSNLFSKKCCISRVYLNWFKLLTKIQTLYVMKTMK